MRSLLQRIAARVGDFATLCVIVGAWEIFAGYILPSYVSTSMNIFPPPSAVVATAAEFVHSGELFSDIAASLRRVLIGFSIAVAIAVPMGLSMGIWPEWRRQLHVLIELLRPIPPFAWIPIGLLWFGVGDAQSIFVIVVASFFPILLNTVAGVDSVERIHLRSALSLGANNWNLFSKIILRSAMPSIFVGLRVGLGFAWMVLVASELIGSISGLGNLILDSRNLGLPSLAFMGMIVIGIIGYLLDVGMRWLEQRILRWR